MNKQLNSNQLKIGILAYCLIGTLFSCEENMEPALPADGEIAYVNFVNLGEAFLYGVNDTLYRDNRLYINDSINNPPYDKYNNRSRYPIVFTTEGISKPELIRQYPTTVTGISSVQDNSGGGGVHFLPMHAGDYRFIYTSRDRTYLHTANETLQKNSYNMLYLVESPDTDAAYTVISVAVEMKERIKDKVTVLFVNLSPDAGEVEAYRVDAAGNEIAADLPAPLSFGHYAPAELSLEGTEDTHNSILLRFRHPGAGDELQAVAVPAEKGAVYTLLLRGFTQLTERKIKKDNENYAEVTIFSDLRCTLRRVFY